MSTLDGGSRPDPRREYAIAAVFQKKKKREYAIAAKERFRRL
jgi:hypothetical protein